MSGIGWGWVPIAIVGVIWVAALVLALVARERQADMRARVLGAQRLETLAATETDPEKKARLLKDAETLWGRV